MWKPEDLHESPNALAPFYRRFRVGQRLLLSGHSHQAWPDCAFEGQQQAWLDAAEHVDGKWERAFAVAGRVQQGYRTLLDDDAGHITLGESTHQLACRFLSALPWKEKPRLVSSDGEFHSLRRQLDRLAEEGLEVKKVPALPAATVAKRLMEAVDERTSAVLVSAVFFSNAHIVPGLGDLLDACQAVGAELLVDAYHALNVVPFSLKQERLEGAYVTGGGYKYCQLGEANAFLRTPGDCALRPVITGWFSEFDTLAAGGDRHRVAYGTGAFRFAGATYDPASHYRAAAVFDFFEEQGLTPRFLRAVSRHQVERLARSFDDLGLDPACIDRDRTVPLEEIGGFLTLTSSKAGEFCRLLGEKGVYCDHRNDALRLGPAPYLCDDQLDEAMQILGRIAR